MKTMGMMACFAFLVTISLSACSPTVGYPVAAIGDDGQIFKGYAYRYKQKRNLVVTNDKLIEIGRDGRMIGKNGGEVNLSHLSGPVNVTYEISNGELSCRGYFDATVPSRTVEFPVICSNGGRGFGSLTREPPRILGTGSARMNDGSDWKFVIGRAAEEF